MVGTDFDRARGARESYTGTLNRSPLATLIAPSAIIGVSSFSVQ